MVYEIDVNVVKNGTLVETLETQLVLNKNMNGEDEWKGLDIADSLIEGLIETYPTIDDLEHTLNGLIVDKDLFDIEQDGLVLTL